MFRNFLWKAPGRDLERGTMASRVLNNGDLDGGRKYKKNKNKDIEKESKLQYWWDRTRDASRSDCCYKEVGGQWEI